MCGINLAYCRENIEKMNEAIAFRGIRSTVTELNSDFFLGHVRLPIQGLSEEFDHPLRYKQWTSSFVGEIFNYKDLDISAKSDLPVLTTCWDLYGKECFDEFDGFWSAVFFNHRSKLVHVFTDYLAKKPLYYRESPLGISSNIKPLTLAGGVTPDPIYHSAVKKWGYCPDNNTPYIEIKKIPPAYHLVLDPRLGKIVFQEYYTKLQPKTHAPLRILMEEAVRNRTVSDIPISVLMSGGLDSTIIYYLLREYCPELQIFHIENQEEDYLNYINFRSGDKITKLSIDQDNLDLKTIFEYNEGPVDLGSVIPQYLLGKAIKDQGFNICISGDGADELFGGYKRAMEYDSQASDIFHELVYYHLPRLDKLMMAHTVELRCPFLARPIIEYALALPWEQRKGKNHLKGTFDSMVPREIRDRVKKPLRWRIENG